MLHACAARFDVTENLEKFFSFWWSKQGLTATNTRVLANHFLVRVHGSVSRERSCRNGLPSKLMSNDRYALIHHSSRAYELGLYTIHLAIAALFFWDPTAVLLQMICLLRSYDMDVCTTRNLLLPDLVLNVILSRSVQQQRLACLPCRSITVPNCQSFHYSCGV